jgi:GR25 family glycosyltransferase involved in LPS biosynthesis
MKRYAINCINLERAHERKHEILTTWKDYEINFFKAFDRRELFHRDAPSPIPYIVSSSLKRINRPLSKGEIACATSHCLLLEKLLAESDDSHFITFEDDVTPLHSADYFYESIATSFEEFPNLEVLLCHTPSEHSHYRFSERGETCSLLSAPPWGNQCTVFSRSGAERMVSLLRTMSGAADHYWIDFAESHTIGMVNNPLCVHLHNDTYIGNDYRGTHREFIS